MTSFPPPGTSIRHVEPGPEPKPGREAEPRCWHTDRRSDPLAGPGVCWGHHLSVQDTEQIEGHTDGERCVKVRYDSDTCASLLFWHSIREEEETWGRWDRTGSEPRRIREQESRNMKEKLHVSMGDQLWQEHELFDPPNVLICVVYFKPLLLLLSAS